MMTVYASEWNQYGDREFNATFVYQGRTVAWAIIKLISDNDFGVVIMRTRNRMAVESKLCTMELYCRRTGELLRTVDLKEYTQKRSVDNGIFTLEV